MSIALMVAVAAALIGLLRGGSLDSLASTPFKALPLLFASLVVQAGADIWNPDWLPEWGALLVLLLTNAGVAIFLLLNRHLPGMMLAAIGLVLNVVVIAANGAMPVSADAIEASGMGSLEEFGLKHELITDDTLLPFLADVIPVPLIAKVVSLGDVFLGAGIGWLVYRRMMEPEPEVSRPAVSD
jgi:hypothetical protein